MAKQVDETEMQMKQHYGQSRRDGKINEAENRVISSNKSDSSLNKSNSFDEGKIFRAVLFLNWKVLL